MNFDKKTREQAVIQLAELNLQDWIKELIRKEVEKFEQRRNEKALSAGAS